MKRPNKADYYLNIAKVVSSRSTCLRRHYGALIVKDDQIISTGYNGAPRGAMNCETCLRDELQIAQGERYELCRAVHAEMNAVIHAGRQACIGADLYLYGIDCKTQQELNDRPCNMCRRVILNAGIDTVYTLNDTLYRMDLIFIEKAAVSIPSAKSPLPQGKEKPASNGSPFLRGAFLKNNEKED